MQANTEPALRLTSSDRHAREAPPRARLTDDHVERNPGAPLDLDIVRALRVNRSAVERRAATIPTRRTVK
jgi:deoxyribose-phosphate aldolase